MYTLYFIGCGIPVFIPSGIYVVNCWDMHNFYLYVHWWGYDTYLAAGA